MSLLFFFVVIAYRITIIGLTHPSGNSGQISHSLRQSSLAASAVSQNDNITDLITGVNLHIVTSSNY